MLVSHSVLLPLLVFPDGADAGASSAFERFAETVVSPKVGDAEYASPISEAPEVSTLPLGPKSDKDLPKVSPPASARDSLSALAAHIHICEFDAVRIRSGVDWTCMLPVFAAHTVNVQHTHTRKRTCTRTHVHTIRNSHTYNSIHNAHTYTYTHTIHTHTAPCKGVAPVHHHSLCILGLHRRRSWQRSTPQTWVWSRGSHTSPWVRRASVTSCPHSPLQCSCVSCSR